MLNTHTTHAALATAICKNMYLTFILCVDETEQQTPTGWVRLRPAQPSKHPTFRQQQQAIIICEGLLREFSYISLDMASSSFASNLNDSHSIIIDVLDSPCSSPASLVANSDIELHSPGRDIDSPASFASTLVIPSPAEIPAELHPPLHDIDIPASFASTLVIPSPAEIPALSASSFASTLVIPSLAGIPASPSPASSFASTIVIHSPAEIPALPVMLDSDIDAGDEHFRPTLIDDDVLQMQAASSRTDDALHIQAASEQTVGRRSRSRSPTRFEESLLEDENEIWLSCYPLNHISVSSDFHDDTLAAPDSPPQVQCRPRHQGLSHEQLELSMARCMLYNKAEKACKASGLNVTTWISAASSSLLLNGGQQETFSKMVATLEPELQQLAKHLLANATQAGAMLKHPEVGETHSSSATKTIQVKLKLRPSIPYYVGITENPAMRFDEHQVASGFNAMHVWLFSDSHESAACEVSVLKNVSHLGSCQNKSKGGERRSSGKPHFMYVVFKE